MPIVVRSHQISHKHAIEQISAGLKVLPKCRLDENHKRTLDINTKQLKQLINLINKTEEQILEYFEFKNGLFLQLQITSLPIPSREFNLQRLKIQNRLNIKHKGIKKSIKQGSVSENTLSKTLSADQFRTRLAQNQNNTIQTPIRISRKRHSNDFDSTIVNQSPIKRLSTEKFNETSSLTFVDKILETINEKSKITFVDAVSKNTSNYKNKNSTHDNFLNKPKERKLLKNISFEESYERPSEQKLISEQMESTKFERQKIFGELFDEVLFDEIFKYSRPFKAAGLNSVYVEIFLKKT
uniref:CDT1 domain-containing protein n=1 Tax=Strongyloides venezuelensis TaxID=75913 RepID=A0A0K0FB30_STRVS